MYPRMHILCRLADPPVLPFVTANAWSKRSGLVAREH